MPDATDPLRTVPLHPMSLRRWFKEKMLGDDAGGNDVPPGSSLVNTFLGREEERVRSLGEYSAANYPSDLRTQLTRREQVTSELLTMNILGRQGRIEAIPRLRELLATYPHLLVYETLINAYLDAGRYDEAKGLAFAARQRRQECIRSQHPEIRGEVEGIHEWTADEIDEYRLSKGD